MEAKDVEQRLKDAFGDILFEEGTHRYHFGDKKDKLISATTFIKNVSNPFDKEKMLKITAAKKGISKRELEDEWEFKATASSKLGTWVHKIMETRIIHSKAGTDPFDDLTKLKKEIPKEDSARSKKLGGLALSLFDDIADEWEPVETEFKIYDLDCVAGIDDKGEPLRLAGTVDALFRNKGTGEFWIWDWKTNKELKDGYGKMFLHPFSDVKECDINKFTLQLSLYKEIIERADVCPISGLKIGYIHVDGYKLIDLTPMPMSGRIQSWD